MVTLSDNEVVVKARMRMADARVDHTYEVCSADEFQQEIVFIVHEARDASCETNV